MEVRYIILIIVIIVLVLVIWYNREKWKSMFKVEGGGEGNPMNRNGRITAFIFSITIKNLTQINYRNSRSSRHQGWIDDTKPTQIKVYILKCGMLTSNSKIGVLDEFKQRVIGDVVKSLDNYFKINPNEQFEIEVSNIISGFSFYYKSVDPKEYIDNQTHAYWAVRTTESHFHQLQADNAISNLREILMYQQSFNIPIQPIPTNSFLFNCGSNAVGAHLKNYYDNVLKNTYHIHFDQNYDNNSEMWCYGTYKEPYELMSNFLYRSYDYLCTFNGHVNITKPEIKIWGLQLRLTNKYNYGNNY